MKVEDIKFRGLRSDGDRWVFGDFINSESGAFIIDEGIEVYPCININDLAEVDPKTVGQFTGLQDKNGADIYSGDNIKCTWDGEFKTIEEAETVYGAGNIVINEVSGKFCVKNTAHSFNGTIDVATKFNEYGFCEDDFAIATVLDVHGNLYTESELYVDSYDTDDSGNIYCDGCNDANLTNFSIYDDCIFNVFEVIGNNNNTKEQ